MTRLVGKTTYMVPFEEKHLVDPRYYAWLSDPVVVQYIGRDEYLKPIDFEEVRRYVESLWRSERCMFLAIHYAADGTFIGTAKINFIDDTGQRRGIAEIGIMIGDPDFRGRGLSVDVLYAASEYAFDTLGARKLTTGAMANNVPVLRAFDRIGFCEEGRLRKQLLVGGELVDHVLLGCFRQELRRG